MDVPVKEKTVIWKIATLTLSYSSDEISQETFEKLAYEAMQSIKDVKQ